MKIEALKLLKAISGPASIAAKKQPQAILNHILLCAAGDSLTISASDLSVFQQVKADCDGTLPATCVFADVFRKVIGGFTGDVELTPAKGKLEVGGSHTIKVATLDASEFVAFPDDSKAKHIDANCAELADAMASVVWCASTEQSRDVIQNVYVKGHNCVATNGHALALVEMESDAGDTELLVHSSLVPVVCEALKSKGAKVSVSGSFLFVTHDAGRVAVKLSEVQYPNYRQVIPKEPKTIGTVTDSMLSVIKLAVSLYGDKCFCSRFEFGADGCAVSHATGSNEFRSVVPGKFKELTIAIDGKYLIGAMGMLGDVVEFCGGVALSPVVLKAGKSLAVVMPVRLQ